MIGSNALILASRSLGRTHARTAIKMFSPITKAFPLIQTRVKAAPPKKPVGSMAPNTECRGTR